MSAIDTRKPKVLISTLALTKINYWVQASSVEISGLGKCTYNEKTNEFHVSDVYLLEQTNTGTSTDIEADSVAKLLYETRDVEGSLNFWWHSHVNMGVFWSGTDTDTIKEMGDQGFCLATVFNKKREMKSAVYYKAEGFHPAIFLDDLETQEATTIDESVLKFCQEEMEKKCKRRVFTPPKKYGGLTSGKINKGSSTPKTFGTNRHGSKPSGQVIQTTRENLGFEYIGTTDQWNKLASKEHTYAGFLFVDNLKVKNREHGSIHPTLWTVWDDNLRAWVSIASFASSNPDDTTGFIYKKPFSVTDFHYICTLYRQIFENPPCELADIEEFVADAMDYHVTDFWYTPNDQQLQIDKYNEFKMIIGTLKALHSTRKIVGA